ncbi:hypothetical protein CISIN_1g0065083mg, partial [Citrus sinensis]
QSSVDGDVHIRFEILLNEVGSQPEVSTSVAQLGIRRIVNEGIEDRMSFSVCKKLVQLMQGNIWMVPSSHGFAQSMGLVLRFQLRPS